MYHSAAIYLLRETRWTIADGCFSSSESLLPIDFLDTLITSQQHANSDLPFVDVVFQGSPHSYCGGCNVLHDASGPCAD